MFEDYGLVLFGFTVSAICAALVAFVMSRMED